MSILTTNKKSIEAVVKSINEKNGTELSAHDALSMHLNKCYADFKAYADHEHTKGELDVAIVPVKEAVNNFNAQVTVERLESLSGMSHQDAIRDYLNNQYVKGARVKPSKDTGYDLELDADVTVDAYAVLETVAPTELDAIVDACVIFADNCARREFKKEVSISRNSMSASYIDLRKRKGWDKPIEELSNSELARELTEIASIISCKMPIKMIGADALFVKNTLLTTKDNANQAGAFVKRDEKTIIRAIFRAMYTRFNKLAYATQDQTRYEKNCLTAKSNKAMAESETKPDETAVGGPVTTEVANEQ